MVIWSNLMTGMVKMLGGNRTPSHTLLSGETEKTALADGGLENIRLTTVKRRCNTDCAEQTLAVLLDRECASTSVSVAKS